MYELTIKDVEGNTYSFSLGPGSKFLGLNSLAFCDVSADLVLANFDQTQISAIYDHFYNGEASFIAHSNTMQRYSQNTQANPMGASFGPYSGRHTLKEALAHSEILVRKTKRVKDAVVTDDRTNLRMEVRLALSRIIALQQSKAGQNQKADKQKADKQKADKKEVWGVAFANDFSDEQNPALIQYRKHKTLKEKTTGEHLQAQAVTDGADVHFLRSLNYDPAKISEQEFAHAMEVAGSTWEDTRLRSEFVGFTKQYAASETLGRSENGAAFEVIFTMALAKTTANAEAAASIGNQSWLINEFRKVSDLLVGFDSATKQLKAKGTGGKANSATFGDFERIDDVATASTESPISGTGWVKITLVYEGDGEPLANQKYIIKDCEGTEHTGKTNSEGVARLSDLPKGEVEISFPEVQGWS